MNNTSTNNFKLSKYWKLYTFSQSKKLTITSQILAVSLASVGPNSLETTAIVLFNTCAVYLTVIVEYPNQNVISNLGQF